MWEQHEWVYGLSSPAADVRAAARARSRDLDEHASSAFRRYQAECHAQPGGWRPITGSAFDLWLDADRATASGPVTALLSPNGATEEAESLVLALLEWEAAFPEEWDLDAGRMYSRWTRKEVVLRHLARVGVAEVNAQRTRALVIAAIERRYRAKDWRYAGLARSVDSANLRETLAGIAERDPDASARRAGFLLSILEDRKASVSVNAYQRWADRGLQEIGPRPPPTP